MDLETVRKAKRRGENPGSSLGDGLEAMVAQIGELE